MFVFGFDPAAQKRKKHDDQMVIARALKDARPRGVIYPSDDRSVQAYLSRYRVWQAAVDSVMCAFNRADRAFSLADFERECGLVQVPFRHNYDSELSYVCAIMDAFKDCLYTVSTPHQELMYEHTLVITDCSFTPDNA